MYVWVHSKVRGGGKKQPPPSSSSSRDVTTIASAAPARNSLLHAVAGLGVRLLEIGLCAEGFLFLFFLFFFGGFLSLLSKEGGRRRSGNNPIPKPIAVSLGVAKLLLLNVDSRRNAEILAFFTPTVSIRSDGELEGVAEFVPEFWVCGILLRSGSSKALKSVMGCAH
jgi:hypothetical protein